MTEFLTIVALALGATALTGGLIAGVATLAPEMCPGLRETREPAAPTNRQKGSRT